MRQLMFSSTAIPRLLPALALLLALTGCASISVRRGSEFATQQKPDLIYVAKFSTTQGDFNVDREGVELRNFKHELQIALQAAQAADLSNRLIPAESRSITLGSPRQRAWLIRGEFVRVNQGSRFLRTAIGFGAGGTKLETRVFVYDLSSDHPEPFLTFSTTGGSNAEPGAVTGLATDPLTLVIQTALSGASGFSHGITEDTKRTAREITATLSDYMYRSGWISQDRWIKPKDVEPGDTID